MVAWSRLREDFAEMRGFPIRSEALQRQTFFVSPMGPTCSGRHRKNRLSPGRTRGFEPAEWTRSLNDVRSQPGALPLLEHALREWWRTRPAGTPR